MVAPNSKDQVIGQSIQLHGFRTVTTLVILFLSAAYIYLQLVIIPKFEMIFQEALPGVPLPTLTLFVIAAKIPLAIIALVWPIAGIVLAHRQPKTASSWLYIGLFLMFLSVGITVIALFMPMVIN